MITSEKKQTVMTSVQTHKTDVGSPQVQVAVLTERIKEITAHLKINIHDHKARRGLLQMVGRRKRLLAYLERKDFAAYQALIAKLGLRK
jgi:small subunit ribosomal protein S15